AIIGAGPAGLSASYFLALKGHQVTVFDSLPAGGGMLRIGPPGYRLPLESIDKDVDHIASLGVKFKFNRTIGRDIMFSKLLQDYDAVFISTGTTLSRSTRVKNAEKCILALDFLKDNKIGTYRKVSRQVIIIGGGNVALDVAREVLRLQNMQYADTETITKTVSLEDWDEMPASKEEIKEAKEENVQFNPGWGPEEVVLDKNGKINGLLCKKVKTVFNKNGMFSPIFEDDKQMMLEGEMIIEAIGQAPDFSYIPDDMFKKLEFTQRKKIKVDENGRTSLAKVFAGGDIVNTNLDAVSAVADAKLASEGIHNYLIKIS
ncbi:MAG TPA: FAD-dependent oxidoreductase, partial [Spirochaetota bacterium]|nr:FAD-dependent oxidoreductase [Spirochaetota bacterium]